MVGVVPLLGGVQASEEGLDEALQAGQHAPRHGRIDQGVVEQLVQPDAKPPFHGKLLPRAVLGRTR
jgi:hypothetical protein